MSESVCRHGVRMERSCIKCGRFVEVVDEAYKAKQADFYRSIQDLEAMLVPFLEEAQKAKAESEDLDRLAKQEELPPPDRPWYKNN